MEPLLSGLSPDPVVVRRSGWRELRLPSSDRCLPLKAIITGARAAITLVRLTGSGNRNGLSIRPCRLMSQEDCDWRSSRSRSRQPDLIDDAEATSFTPLFAINRSTAAFSCLRRPTPGTRRSMANLMWLRRQARRRLSERDRIPERQRCPARCASIRYVGLSNEAAGDCSPAALHW